MKGLVSSHGTSPPILQTSPLSNFGGTADGAAVGEDNTIHIFSVASGHLYERFLKIMMLSTIKK